MTIKDYQRLSKAIKDYQRLLKTFKDYQRLLKTFKDYQILYQRQSKTISKTIKVWPNFLLAFRCSKSNNLHRVCGGIAGDANLYTLFRVDGQPIKCPFGTTQSFKFSYNRGKGDCKWPESELVPCTDTKRFTLHYQACPNVQGSELMSKSLSLWWWYFHIFLVGKSTLLVSISCKKKLVKRVF